MVPEPVRDLFLGVFYDLQVISEGIRVPVLSVDPLDADVPAGEAIIWVSDGTGSGDDGDLMVKINDGSTVSVGTITDFSTL
jgi:hypothetical protein